MAKLTPSKCRLVVRRACQGTRTVEFIGNYVPYLRAKMPADAEPYTWIYDRIFENCPLTWAEFCKVKLIELEIP